MTQKDSQGHVINFYTFLEESTKVNLRTPIKFRRKEHYFKC
jgi:hypothetical protein